MTLAQAMLKTIDMQSSITRKAIKDAFFDALVCVGEYDEEVQNALWNDSNSKKIAEVYNGS